MTESEAGAAADEEEEEEEEEEAEASGSEEAAEDGADEASCEEKLRGVSLKRPAPESGGDDAAEAEGGAKRPAPSAAAAEGGDAVCFRLLVPARRTGPLIGRGGASMKRMRDATGARIRVLEPVAGCEERVVELSSGVGEGDSPPAQARASPRNPTHACFARALCAR
jgi:hypothetical protein